MYPRPRLIGNSERVSVFMVACSNHKDWTAKLTGQVHSSVSEQGPNKRNRRNTTKIYILHTSAGKENAVFCFGLEP